MQDVNTYSAFLNREESSYGITARESRGEKLLRGKASRHLSTRPPHRVLPSEAPLESDKKIAALARRVAELESRLDAAGRLPANGFEPVKRACRERFAVLVDQWKNESITSSSFLRDRVMHPAYLQIIGMGREALPLILMEMAEEPDHWGPALSAITGENPTGKADAGDVEAITRAWLRWALAKGLRFGEQEEEELQGLSTRLAKSDRRKPHSNQPSDD